MEHERKVQTYQGWFLVLGIVVQIVLMGILVAFNFKNATTMAFVMKLNIYMGFIAGLIVFVRAKLAKFYSAYSGGDLNPTEDGYMKDIKIKGISIVTFERIFNFSTGIVVGVIFWALPFTGMIAK